MSVILMLIFFSMLVAGGFLAAFLWAVRSGQFDDQYTPSVRVLFGNNRKTHPERSEQANSKLAKDNSHKTSASIQNSEFKKTGLPLESSNDW